MRDTLADIVYRAIIVALVVSGIAPIAAAQARRSESFELVIHGARADREMGAFELAPMVFGRVMLADTADEGPGSNPYWSSTSAASPAPDSGPRVSTTVISIGEDGAPDAFEDLVNPYRVASGAVVGERWLPAIAIFSGTTAFEQTPDNPYLR